MYIFLNLNQRDQNGFYGSDGTVFKIELRFETVQLL